MLSYDRLRAQKVEVSEEDVLRNVLDWKKCLAGVKDDEIRRTIRSLLILGWIRPEISFPDKDDY